METWYFIRFIQNGSSWLLTNVYLRFFYLIVILRFVSGTYTLTFTHRRQVSHRIVVLSVTLFRLKINSIVSCLLPDIKCSLYIDDLAIYYSFSHMPSI